MDSALHRCRVRCGRPIETFFKALTIVTLPRQNFLWFRHVEVLQKTSSAGLFFFLKDMALQLRAMHKTRARQTKSPGSQRQGQFFFRVWIWPSKINSSIWSSMGSFWDDWLWMVTTIMAVELDSVLGYSLIVNLVKRKTKKKTKFCVRRPTTKTTWTIQEMMPVWGRRQRT